MDSEPALGVAPKLVKKVRFSIKFLIILIVAIAGLLLVGYIVATVLKLSNDGINSQISQLHKENEELKASNQEYSHNNDVLHQKISELSLTNQELSQNVVKFKVQNAKFAEHIDELNETNAELDVELDHLQTVQSDLQMQVNSFKNESAELSGEVDDLDHWEGVLKQQMSSFATLRAEIANYSSARSESLEETMQRSLTFLQNLTAMDYLDKKIDLFQVALDAEFLENRQSGFSRIEFDRFLQSASRLINETYVSLSSLYPFDALTKNAQGLVSWDQVTVIVNELVQNDQAEKKVMFSMAMQDSDIAPSPWIIL